MVLAQPCPMDVQRSMQVHWELLPQAAQLGGQSLRPQPGPLPDKGQHAPPLDGRSDTAQLQGLRLPVVFSGRAWRGMLLRIAPAGPVVGGTPGPWQWVAAHKGLLGVSVHFPIWYCRHPGSCSGEACQPMDEWLAWEGAGTCRRTHSLPWPCPLFSACRTGPGRRTSSAGVLPHGLYGRRALGAGLHDLQTKHFKACKGQLSCALPAR